VAPPGRAFQYFEQRVPSGAIIGSAAYIPRGAVSIRVAVPGFVRPVMYMLIKLIAESAP
jgi:hypothetical protein